MLDCSPVKSFCDVFECPRLSGDCCLNKLIGTLIEPSLHGAPNASKCSTESFSPLSSLACVLIANRCSCHDTDSMRKQLNYLRFGGLPVFSDWPVDDWQIAAAEPLPLVLLSFW